jgi:hypothetical protein
MTLAQKRGGRLVDLPQPSLVVGPPKQERRRLTKVEQARLDEVLLAVIEEMWPITVRGVFYQAEVAIPEIVPKTERGYGVVQRRLVTLRKRGVIPYSRITDGTRIRRGHTRYDRLEDFQVAAAEIYLKNYWAKAPVYVEVWIEKDALAGVIFQVVVEEWGLDLMVNRGFASITYLYEAGEYLKEVGKEAHILLLSDYDPSGKCAAGKVKEGLKQFAKGVVVHVHDIAVTAAQIRRWKLPTRPTKKSDKRGEKFETQFERGSVELDAIPPDKLRQLVSDAIARHADPREIAQMKMMERGEKEIIRDWKALPQDDES